MRQKRTRYVDLDGTLAYFHGWEGPFIIGKPIQSMVDKVKTWLKEGDTIKIFTARLSTDGGFTKAEELQETKATVKAWVIENIGQELEVTCEKGAFDICYDDRVEHILFNSGQTREERLLDAIGNMRGGIDINDTEILNWVISCLHHTILVQNK